MKHFGKAFSELLFRSGLTQKAIGEKMQTSHVTVTRWKDQATIDAAQLEKLCRIFRVPITYFFDADVVGEAATTATADNENALHLAMLEQKVAMQQRIIEEKERTIQILLKQ